MSSPQSPQTTFSVFQLTEAEAIEILESPPDKLDLPSDRYIAASQLSQYSSPRTVNALIAAIHNNSPDLDNRITRRKAVESLGKIKAKGALSTIQRCLQDEDCYTVENAVWAIGEIGTTAEEILDEIVGCLQRPGQSYRLIIHTLAKLNYPKALSAIQAFLNSDDLSIRSAAISARCQLTQDNSAMADVIEFLQHENVTIRRSCIQDFIDTQYLPAIPAIAKAPISVAFRIRGIQQLTQHRLDNQTIDFNTVQCHLEQVIRDHPQTIEMVHEYDQAPTLEFILNELYETDFGRCYLASQTLLEAHVKHAPMALLKNYEDRGKDDYGAHYHIIKLLGWLHYEPAYPLLIKALHNRLPQYQKSRVAAAIALGELGLSTAIPELQKAWETANWTLQYAILLTLQTLTTTVAIPGLPQGDHPLHPFVQAKLKQWQQST